MIKILIKDGIGTAEVNSGIYNVTANIPGYDNNSIKPSSIKILNNNEYAFTVKATGVLTIHVTDDNLKNKPIKNAKFIRTDEAGNTYGDEIVTDCNGDAKFLNVPFGNNSPYIYFKQTNSFKNYKYNKDIQCIKMEYETQTINIKNYKHELETFTLVDEYYNLPLTGILTLKK